MLTLGKENWLPLNHLRHITVIQKIYGYSYPELAVFMEDLANKHPYWNLHTFKEDLQVNNFYQLNDLKGKEEAYFTEHPFFLSKGNASFIVSKVKCTIRKVEKRTRRN